MFSQGDEDGMLREIFSRLAIAGGTALEIGLQNGVESNTHPLLLQGWRVHWIEGHESFVREIEGKLPDLLSTGQLRCSHAFVTVENFGESLANVPMEPDLVSIDVDGNDYYLFEALPLRPKVVCIEYNSKFPPGMSLVQRYNPEHRWSGSCYFGASLTALWRLAQRRGYTLVGTNIVGSNAFFVRYDLVEDKLSAPATPEALYNPPRYRLIQDVYAQCGHPSDHGPFLEVP